MNQQPAWKDPAGFFCILSRYRKTGKPEIPVFRFSGF